MTKKLFLGLVFALLVAAFISPLASTSPDGLEKVAEDKGFLEKGEGKEVLESPMPDYVLPGIANETLAGSAAGIIGTIVTFGLMYTVSRILLSRKKADYSK